MTSRTLTELRPDPERRLPQAGPTFRVLGCLPARYSARLCKLMPLAGAQYSESRLEELPAAIERFSPAVLILDGATAENLEGPLRRKIEDYGIQVVILQPTQSLPLPEQVVLARMPKLGRKRLISTLTRSREQLLRQPLPHPARPRRFPSVLTVKNGSRVLVLLRDKIAHAEAAGNSVVIRTEGGTVSTRCTLDELQRKLGLSFVRANRSALVNLDAIQFLVRDRDGQHVVVLKDGTRFRLGSRYLSEFFSQFEIVG